MITLVLVWMLLEASCRQTEEEEAEEEVAPGQDLSCGLNASPPSGGGFLQDQRPKHRLSD